MPSGVAVAFELALRLLLPVYDGGKSTEKVTYMGVVSFSK